MRLATTLIPALHALRVRRLRTGLALLGICFGVAAVILIGAWGSIGRAKLDAEIRELGADVVVVLPGAARSEGAWRATGSLRTVTEADAEAIAREAVGIAASGPLLRGSVQVVYGNRNLATTLRGVTPAWFAARPWSVTMGRPLAEDDVRRSAKVALLAHGVAKTLFGEDDPSNKIIRINQVPFTVLGVLAEVGHSLGGEDLDDQVIVPLTTARKRILGFMAGHPTAVGGVTLRVSDGADMGRTADAVRGLLRERHRLAPDGPDDFVVRDLAVVQRAQARGSGFASRGWYRNYEPHAGLRERAAARDWIAYGNRSPASRDRPAVPVRGGAAGAAGLRSRRGAGIGRDGSLWRRVCNLESDDRRGHSRCSFSSDTDHSDFRPIPIAEGRTFGPRRGLGPRPRKRFSTLA
jgi:hypothetical protein